MRISSLILAAVFCAGSAQADSHWLNERFVGVDDLGNEMRCEPIAPSSLRLDCRFQPGTRSFLAMRDDYSQKPSVCHPDGDGRPDQCEGVGSYARIRLFLKTSAVRTGLVACSVGLRDAEMREVSECVEFFNPDANGWGYPSSGNNVVRCHDSTDRLITIDMATRDVPRWSSSYAAGDLQLAIFNRYARNQLFEAPVYAKRDGDQIQLIEHNYNAYQGDVVAILPAALEAGKSVLAQATANNGGYLAGDPTPKSKLLPMNCEVSRPLPPFTDVYPRYWP